MAVAPRLSPLWAEGSRCCSPEEVSAERCPDPVVFSCLPPPSPSHGAAEERPAAAGAPGRARRGGRSEEPRRTGSDEREMLFSKAAAFKTVYASFRLKIESKRFIFGNPASRLEPVSGQTIFLPRAVLPAFADSAVPPRDVCMCVRVPPAPGLSPVPRGFFFHSLPLAPRPPARVSATDRGKARPGRKKEKKVCSFRGENVPENRERYPRKNVIPHFRGSGGESLACLNRSVRPTR